MPAYSPPLKVTKPDERPADVPLGMWEFPDRLTALANSRKVDRRAVAQMAGVDPSTVTRWLQGRGLAGVAASTLNRLEDKFGVPRGTLSGAPSDPAAVANSELAATARRLGLDTAIIDALTDSLRGGKLDEFPEEIRRAILGIVHVLQYPLETAIVTARKARKKQPRGVKFTPETWFTLIREALPPKPASGTFPAAVADMK